MDKCEIIERLKNIAEHAVYTVGEEPFVMSLDDGIAVHEAVELLKKSETNCSEIPNNWIPCSERLPDTNRDVLLQFSTNMGVGFWENGEWGVNTGDNIYSEIGEGEAQPIAWCELPEQYQGSGE